MKGLSLVIIVALVSLRVSGQSGCVPGDTCKAPDCRCWDDPAVPGGFSPSETPQMILISYEYAVNSANVDRYTGLFKGITNPNGCDPKATYFVQELNTDFTVVKELYDAGNEIGMTSSDGIIPSDGSEWLSTYKNVKSKITSVLVPGDAIQGSRGPELSAGGDDQFAAMDQIGLTYDSTCANTQYSYKDNLLWPYTYDYVYETPKCNIGKAPTTAHKGKWQFLVATTRYKGQPCASLSACSPFVNNAQDAYDLLFESFSAHYEGKRSPFVLYIDPLWLSIDHQYEGTKQFLQFVRSSFKDTWFLTTQQALAWIKSPVKSSGLDDFKPWSCL